MGPNGAGKTLFLRILSGLVAPTSGEVNFLSAAGLPNEKPDLAMLFQQAVLLRRSSAQNIEYILRKRQISKSEIGTLTNNVLAKARLAHRARTHARHLSGGEKQRLALARALVVNPEILLLDEITASLDPASVYIVEEMIKKASREGAKIFFITHDVRQAKRIADDIIFMHEGQILAHEPADEFFKRPGSQQAQAFLDGRVPDQTDKE